MTDAAGPATDRVGLGVCAGDYDNDGWLDLFVTYYGTERALPQSRRRPLRGRDRGGRAATTGHPLGLGLHASSTTTATGGSICSSRTTWCFDLADRARARAGRELPLEGHPGQLRPEGPADRHQPALPQRRRRPLPRRLGASRESRSVTRALLDDRGRRRLRRRRLGRHLRGVRLDRGDPVPQQPRRHLHRRRGARAAPPTARTATRRPAWALAVGDFNGDGRLDLLKTHFADDIPALYRNLGRRPVRGRGDRRGARRWRTDTWSGARACPTSTTTAGRTSSTSPATSTRRSRAQLPQYPHRGPRVVFRNLGGARFEDVTDAAARRRDAPHSSRGAAFGDFDNDGDIDVLVMNMNEPPSLLRNDYAGANALARSCSSRARRRTASGIGATVVVVGGRPHAGAGRAQPVELLLARRPAAALRPGRGSRGRRDRGALAERGGRRAARRRRAVASSRSRRAAPAPKRRRRTALAVLRRIGVDGLIARASIRVDRSTSMS